MSTTLIFDGYCGFCTRAVQALQRLDRHERLRVVAWQTPGTLEEFRLSRTQVQQAAWLISANGQRQHGAKAIVGALALAIDAPVLIRIVDIQIISWLAAATYTWISRNRYRLRGVQAYCLQQATNCTDGEASCRLPFTNR
jgi:predicted DCC family thiol-disulfide oxidoreductase YuxK